MSRAGKRTLYSVSIVFASLVFVWGQTPSAGSGQSRPSVMTADSQGETQAAQPQQQVYESASVLKAVTRLVLVDVVASDKKGEPIADLKQSDFTLLEDGKEQTIKVFSFQQPGQQHLSATPASQKEKLPSNIYTNIPSYKPDGALNIVLLDALNTTMPNQAYVRDQMIHYLESMPQDRPVAVYVLGSRLRLLQDFTTDRAVLKEVVRKLKSFNSPLLDNSTGNPAQEVLPPGVADSTLLPASMMDSIMSFEQERTSFQTDLRIAYTLNAMNVLARQLAGYSGRKNLVWVSEAFPLTIDPNLQLSDPYAATRNYGPEIAAAAETMIDAQIAIYPVDARGLVGPAYFSAANSGRDQFGRSLSRGDRLAGAIAQGDTALQSAHASMQDLAERTGGKAFYNRNDIDGAIRRSFDDGATYYTLAYYPANSKWDGKFRKIHLKVDRPGIKLRYRLGYYAVDPKAAGTRNEKQQTAIFSDAMSIETPVATALAFHAGVITPSALTQNKVYVNFGIDAHAMSFDEDTAGLRHARVECAITAFNEKGKYVKSVSGVTSGALKPETFNKVMQSYFPCRQAIDLPPGTYVLRLGVRDLGTGLLGTTNARVTVPATEESLKEKK
jgi:VWFA-related protein